MLHLILAAWHYVCDNIQIQTPRNTRLKARTYAETKAQS